MSTHTPTEMTRPWCAECGEELTRTADGWVHEQARHGTVFGHDPDPGAWADERRRRALDSLSGAVARLGRATSQPPSRRAEYADVSTIVAGRADEARAIIDDLLRRIGNGEV